jgi:hypothetical protein
VNPRAISSETLGPTLGGTIEIVNEKGYRGLRVKQHAASSTRNARSIWAVAGFQDVVHASRRCSQRAWPRRACNDRRGEPPQRLSVFRSLRPALSHSQLEERRREPANVSARLWRAIHIPLPLIAGERARA